MSVSTAPLTLPSDRPAWLARRGDARWLAAMAVITFFVAAPLVALAVLSLDYSDGIWPHLISNVIPRSAWTTLILMGGVGALSVVIGVTSAWLVTMCEFPGRKLFDWALLAPLAVPTYIVAYAYVEFLDFSGPIQSAVRGLFGYKLAYEYWFPDIRSLEGAILVMAFVLYPYVYLTTRALFLMQSSCALDVSRTLGAGPVRLFFAVAIPLARPAIAVGMTLVLMETLNDIGAVEFFGVKTLTFAVYDTWLNRNSLAGASQIALALLAVVLALIWVERFNRRKQRFHLTTTRYRSLPSFPLRSWKAGLAVLACFMPILLGFLIPAGVLVDFASRRLETLSQPGFVSAAGNSVILAGSAALLTVFCGLILAYVQRINGSIVVRVLARISSVGYAVPGTVLAVGILIPMAALDNAVDGAMRQLFGLSTGLLLSGSGIAIVYAYTARFLTVSFGAIETGLAKVSPSLDMAARALGRNRFAALREVHLPLIKPVLFTAAMLVFVDCMKELPATILLRPFNFDTLATLVYNAASLEAFEDGSVAALTIVALGVIPVVFLARTSTLTFRSAKSGRRSGP